MCDELTQAGIEHTCHFVADREMLGIALRERIVADCRRREDPPMLCLSLYGEEAGARLTSGELVSWAELRSMLLSVRHAHPGGTLICFLYSKGGKLTDQFKPNW